MSLSIAVDMVDCVVLNSWTQLELEACPWEPVCIPNPVVASFALDANDSSVSRSPSFDDSTALLSRLFGLTSDSELAAQLAIPLSVIRSGFDASAAEAAAMLLSSSVSASTLRCDRSCVESVGRRA